MIFRNAVTHSMFDYMCEYPDGRHVLVSQMATQDIKICLGVPNLETFDATIQNAVRERLVIEMLIRQMGLRHPTPADRPT